MPWMQRFRPFAVSNELTIFMAEVMRAINSPQTGLPVREISAAYAALQGDGVILGDATSAAFTVTLPPIADLIDGDARKMYWIGKVDSSGNAVTIDGDGSETIDGATTLVVSTQWDVKTIIAYSGGWITLN